jgi:protein translocase SecG subunit
MSILFIFLSGIMFLNSIVLILLILVQVPKKEAGAGMAFGGSAADALFGAGSGSAITTITKYSAGLFFGAALLMAILAAHIKPATGSKLRDELNKSLGPSGPTAPAMLPGPASNGTMLNIPSPAAAAPSNSSAPAPSPSPEVPPVTPLIAPPAAPPIAPPAAPPAAVVPTPNTATNR